MKKLFNIIAILGLILPSSLYARSQIHGAGSSTVYPFITTVAEEFGKKSPYKTPIIESTGTGGGFKLFCQGVGKKTTDISNASRAIKDSEKKLCAKNGVKNIVEVKIGYDGIVVSNSIDAKQYKLTRKQLFLALASKIPQNGKLIANPYQKWSDIDSSLPNNKIVVYGPPPTSGTRDAFIELVMQKSCVKLAEFIAAYPNKKVRKKKCGLIREDGNYITSGENDNIIVQKLNNNKNALGIFGYSFLENNSDDLQGSIIGGYNPTFENISSGKYPISRSLFVYIKEDHYKKVASLKPFVKELISKDAIGQEGYLTYKGLIPVSKKELKKIRQNILSGLKLIK